MLLTKKQVTLEFRSFCSCLKWENNPLSRNTITTHTRIIWHHHINEIKKKRIGSDLQWIVFVCECVCKHARAIYTHFKTFTQITCYLYFLFASLYPFLGGILPLFFSIVSLFSLVYSKFISCFFSFIHSHVLWTPTHSNFQLSIKK